MEQKVIHCTRKLQSLSGAEMVFCFQEKSISLQGEGDVFHLFPVSWCWWLRATQCKVNFLNNSNKSLKK